ncbi:photosynthetic protein synthase I [Archangium violaceum Cb vi76]|uniref:Photosynthetic protein synthase I n=1 Tax=Archangium violaceum Cb vi76 TaxID=1406225 RepID=A0A084SX35_9BACT|nr:photosynthetic protein synthase I [Archangium violaceum Cb vi76]
MLVAGLVRPREEPLPRLGRLPAFTFTRQDGEPFGLKQLEGQPWVANFIFTRCPTICPVFTRKMAGVQKQTAELGRELALVSFSVDPKYDTPERLTDYARKHGADPKRWSFLTGDYQQLKDTIVGGFKIAMGREEGADESDIASIFHGSHFVLVDRTGEIRGYYNSEHDDDVARLVLDTARLVKSGE